MIKQSLITLVALTFSLNLYAGSDKHEHEHEEHREQYREHSAHVHGLAEMTLAKEGKNLEIELESPAANIVGFEYQASTDKQKQVVHEAEELLEKPKKLFSFHGTRCEIANVSVDVSSLLEHHDEKHEEHGHHDDKHDEHQETHSEIKAHYQFTCQQGSKLKSVSVELLEHFTGIEQLNTEWITETKQGAVILSHDSKVIYLQ